MRLAVCVENDRETLLESLRQAVSPDASVDIVNCADALLDVIWMHRYDAVISALPGAEGLETVYSVREQDPDLPVIWISDDADFFLSAYRLNIARLLTWPVSPGQLQEALRRCEDWRDQYGKRGDHAVL